MTVRKQIKGGAITYRLFEELGNNALPALETLLLDGWLLRFASGYTRRANCVHPLYGMHTPFDESIRTCETLFRLKKIPCRFKLTDSPELIELDKRLSEMGYIVDASALLMSHPAVSAILYGEENIQTSATPAREWINFFASHKKLDYTDTRTLRQILGRILPEKRFFWKTEKGKVIACVLAVYERGYTGLFDLFVDEAFRGKKHGLSLLRRALAEGVTKKCYKAYLQVDENNRRAIDVYQALGFEVTYRYWYRLKRE